jgi:hypothetical protein
MGYMRLVHLRSQSNLRLVENAFRTSEDECVVDGNAEDSTDDRTNLEELLEGLCVNMRENLRWECRASTGCGSSILQGVDVTTRTRFKEGWRFTFTAIASHPAHQPRAKIASRVDRIAIGHQA